jgi:hypothetical protein
MNCPLDSIKAESNHILLAHKVSIPLLKFLLGQWVLAIYVACYRRFRKNRVYPMNRRPPYQRDVISVHRLCRCIAKIVHVHL